MKTKILAAVVAAASAAAPAAQAQSHGGHGITPAAAQQEAAVSGTGTIKSVNAAKRSVNLSHDPIPAIGWPGMTMDFAVAEGVDFSKLQPGAKIAFTLSKGTDGIYMIDSFKPE